MTTAYTNVARRLPAKKPVLNLYSPSQHWVVFRGSPWWLRICMTIYAAIRV